MERNKPTEEQTKKREDQRSQRIDGIYFHPETGRPHVSVTTVLDGTLMKYPLLIWYANMATKAMTEHPEWADLGYEEAKKLTQAYIKDMGNQAKDRGSRVHEYINTYFKGGSPRILEQDMPYWNAFRQFVAERNPRPIDVEMTLYSEKHGVAGTGDFVGLIEGERLPVVLDVKTGGAWPEHLYQTGAYRGMLAEEGVPLGGTRIIQLKDTGRYSDRIRSTAQEAEHDWELFLSAKDLYVDRNTNKLSKLGYFDFQQGGGDHE